MQCPDCAPFSTEIIEGVSSFSVVNYHRCRDCEHIWTTPKPEHDDPSENFTSERNRPDLKNRW
jgi:hypothetical protein